MRNPRLRFGLTGYLRQAQVDKLETAATRTSVFQLALEWVRRPGGKGESNGGEDDEGLVQKLMHSVTLETPYIMILMPICDIISV